MYRENRKRLSLAMLLPLILTAAAIMGTAFAYTNAFAEDHERENEDDKRHEGSDNGGDNGKSNDEEHNSDMIVLIEEESESDGDLDQSVDLSFLSNTTTFDLGSIEINQPAENITLSENATDAVFTMISFKPLGNETEVQDSEMTVETTQENVTNSTADFNEVSDNELDGQLVFIGGSNFTPGTVVLVWTENELLAIDDVDENGSIESIVRLHGTAEIELFVVESDTLRSGEFTFDGATLSANEENSNGIVAAEQIVSEDQQEPEQEQEQQQQESELPQETAEE